MSGFLSRLLLSFLSLLLCLAPFWIYLMARCLFDPHGFWQNVFLVGVGFYFLGGVQIILLLAFVALMAGIWWAWR